MKRFLATVGIGVIVLAFVVSSVMAQTGTATTTDEEFNREFLRELLREPYQTIVKVVDERVGPSLPPRYTLTPTDNMWTFILLDTATGRAWQVHYSVTEDSAATSLPINSISLIGISDPLVSGRFTLVPTSNMWNFLLLDQIQGRVWQLQFSLQGDNYRWVYRIH